MRSSRVPIWRRFASEAPPSWRVARSIPVEVRFRRLPARASRGEFMESTTHLVPSSTGMVVEVTHPLVQHKLGLLRDVTTTTEMFRQLVNELTLLLTYEATKDLADEEVEIETPLERTSARRISGKKVAVCPILRAGVGMLDAVLSLVPGARVGFIGLFRDEETLEAVEYFVKLPDDLPERDVILLDPMLATGNSTAAAIDTVKRSGATSVRLIALIAAPEGIT